MGDHEKMLSRISLCEIERDFDDGNFDPLYCGLVVSLILNAEKEGASYKSLDFNVNEDAVQ